MRDPELWARISRYSFPDHVPSGPKWLRGSSNPKSRLQHSLETKENWTEDYALRAIEEYRRFIYLTRVAPTQVTPSEVVDKVWHVHMADSADYIDDFSMPLFGEIAHHEPCVGPEEMPRYHDQYQTTRDHYREEFQADPPIDVWDFRTPADLARDASRKKIALLAGFVAGLSVAALLRAAFDFGLWALVGGAVAGFVVFAIVAPKEPGPKYKSSGGCGGGGCGGCGG